MSEITEHSKQVAADRAEQIRLGLQSAGVLYEKAVAEQDWKVLSYGSEKEWAAAEFSPDRFSAENRKRLVGMYSAWGWSQRQIAAATGASQSTVLRDQKTSRESNESQKTDNSDTVDLANARQQAAREREAQRARQREAERLAAAARELENQRRRDALAAGVAAREREAERLRPQGNTADAQAEIRKRVRSREPLQRDRLAAEFGVSEMFVRGTATAEEALWRSELDAAERTRAAEADIERERMRNGHLLAEWVDRENVAVAVFREAPAVVLDDLMRRLADIRRAL